jgi:integrase
MARKAQIENRTQRAKLNTGKLHWHVIEPGLAVGYRRPNRGGAGSWYVRALLDGEHKVAALGTADDQAGIGMDWKQAQAKAREWAAKQTTSGPFTIERAVLDYADDLRARKGERPAREMIGHQTESGEWRGGRLRRYLLPVLGKRLLADLTTAELVSWRNGLVDDDDDEEEVRRSRDSANRVLTMAKAAFNHAFTTGRVADDRAWRKVKPFQDVGMARKVILSESEIQRLIDACGPGLRELVAAGALTGARLGELTAARKRDFDADGKTLTVRGKTGERPIRLDSGAAALLHRLASGKSPQDHLFTTADGGPWTASLHARPFATAVEDAKPKLDPDTVFYSLRHSYISRALRAGVPTKAVADHCGTSMAMLERYYAKFIQSDMTRYAEMAAPAIKITDADDEKVVPFQVSAA